MIRHTLLVIGVIVLISIGVTFGLTWTMKMLPAPEISNSPAGYDSPVSNYLSFNERDNGTTSAVHKTDIITIRLPENPTTGYEWDISRSRGITLLEDKYVYPDPSGKMTSVGGWRHFTLIADTPGPTSFSAINKRSWEPESGNEPSYSLDFVVS